MIGCLRAYLLKRISKKTCKSLLITLKLMKKTRWLKNSRILRTIVNFKSSKRAKAAAIVYLN
jgi:hypothetical protein